MQPRGLRGRRGQHRLQRLPALLQVGHFRADTCAADDALRERLDEVRDAALDLR